MSEENAVNNSPEESCTHDCSTCSANCSSRTGSGASTPESFLAPANKNSRVKKVIGVVSGKGGVGKSFVTVNLAVQLQQKGYQCAVLDADITGPSIPKAFGIKGPARGNDDGIWPIESSKGIRVMSGNQLYAQSVAEGTIGYILASLRRIPQFAGQVQKDGWALPGWTNEGLIGQRVGLVGFGAVARYTAKLLRAFDADIAIWADHVTPEEAASYGAHKASLEEIFSTCKVVSLHLARTPETL